MFSPCCGDESCFRPRREKIESGGKVIRRKKEQTDKQERKKGRKGEPYSFFVASSGLHILGILCSVRDSRITEDSIVPPFCSHSRERSNFCAAICIYRFTELRYKVGPRLRKFAPAARGGQKARSRNLRPAL